MLGNEQQNAFLWPSTFRLGMSGPTVATCDCNIAGVVENVTVNAQLADTKGRDSALEQSLDSQKSSQKKNVRSW